MELSSVGPETLTVPLQPDISQFVKDIDFQVKMMVIVTMVMVVVMMMISQFVKDIDFQASRLPGFY